MRRSGIQPADLVQAFTPDDVAQDFVSSPRWHGWGKDTNLLCPSTQISTYREQLCEPSHPGSIDPHSLSWTGVTCTPEGKVLCLSLPGWGLQGNASALEQLHSLHSLRLVNAANNSLTGEQFSNSQQVEVSRCKLCLMQANAALTGTLPASLPMTLRTHAYGAFPSISIVYLSNNSISGTLPSQWGDPLSGWGPTLEQLYLDNNQLTGHLPQLWSDSNSLWGLQRVHLFNNQLTGPIEWDAGHLPKLRNLVLSPGNCTELHQLLIVSHAIKLQCHLAGALNIKLNIGFAGNEFCGNVPRTLDGVVRSIAGVQDGQQLQLKVMHFSKHCPRYMLSSTGMSVHAVVTGNLAHFVLVLPTTSVPHSQEAHVTNESFKMCENGALFAFQQPLT